MGNYEFLCYSFLWSLFLTHVSSGLAGNVTKHPSWMLLDHEKCGGSAADRIIGGKNATMGSYPWIARIAYVNESATANSSEPNKVFRCGGTLVNKMYVVTAAHCVANLPGKFKVVGARLGEHNIETDPDCSGDLCADPVQDFGVGQIIVHRSYNVPPFKNDIAIIRLDRPANYSIWVKPICLPSGSLLLKDYLNQTAEVAGWGVYDINTPKASPILQTIKMPIVPIEKCIKAFKLHANVGQEQLCVGGELGHDSCGGDSGGPLMKVDQERSAPKYFFIGVVSFGAKFCGQTATPAVYTRISRYIEWILDNISP